MFKKLKSKSKKKLEEDELDFGEANDTVAEDSSESDEFEIDEYSDDSENVEDIDYIEDDEDSSEENSDEIDESDEVDMSEAIENFNSVISSDESTDLSESSSDHAFIEFCDVRKVYKMGETEIYALDGVNFAIDRGEFVIIAGASGAGKSTILNILGGMDTLTSGQIFVDGSEVSKYDNKQLILYRRYDVGFVFQFYNLVQNLTAKENVELATQVSKDPLDIMETIDAVGLTERANNFPSQLSGGEQQRVAIARALAKNPKLLLCDEPTGALDYNTGKAILKLLQDTARSTGMTVIIITHNLALTDIGDKVIKVKNGRIESISLNDNPKSIEDVEW